MHLFHIPQCFIQNRNVHISVLNGALCDIEQVYTGIYEWGQLALALQSTDLLRTLWLKISHISQCHVRWVTDYQVEWAICQKHVYIWKQNEINRSTPILCEVAFKTNELIQT